MTNRLPLAVSEGLPAVTVPLSLLLSQGACRNSAVVSAIVTAPVACRRRHGTPSVLPIAKASGRCRRQLVLLVTERLVGAGACWCRSPRKRL